MPKATSKCNNCGNPISVTVRDTFKLRILQDAPQAVCKTCDPLSNWKRSN